MKILIVTICAAMLRIQVAQADIRLPKILGSNMVLQQGRENLLWGWADAQEPITVRFAGKTLQTKTDKQGKWKISLPSMEYGGPYTIQIQGKNAIELTNILIGEVWVCSGQSNMGMSVRSSLNAPQEIAEANYPKIRLFVVHGKASTTPAEDLENGEWVECSPTTVGGFSGVGYYFGRELHKKLSGIPIGLINSSVGGTNAETWMNAEAVKESPDLQESYKKLSAFDPQKDRQEKYDRIKDYLGEFPTNDAGMRNGKALYAATDLQDDDWPLVQAPTPWNTLIDGVGWYRKEFTLTAEEAKGGIALHLSKLDDNDITWLNGVQVGATNSSVEDRIYVVDAPGLKVGKNLLAIRIVDTGGSGGMKGKPEEMFVQTDAQRIALGGKWKHKITEIPAKLLELNANEFPTLLYNSMINPLTPYGIQGVVWYQGESNTANAEEYSRTFPALIKGWRQRWGQGDFPFLFVSLANVGIPKQEPSESNFAELRESQTKTLSLPNTGMALAIDLGIPHDIHPPNKQDVGKRLALNALNKTYQKEVVYSGPMYQSMKIQDKKVKITFNIMNSELVVKDRYGYIHGFTMAGSDKKFYWAQARLIDERTVEVTCDRVATPVAVRYGWADNPDDVNLYNQAGLPANPFRTDNWAKTTP
ncbi:sialate O-acetylesterase [Dyadobacter jejuensis]|nr:sialate O-acetylesterase [Dyadobacter jejuensis]